MNNNTIKLVNGAVFTLKDKYSFLYENGLLHEVKLINNKYEKTGNNYTIKEVNRLLYA